MAQRGQAAVFIVLGLTAFCGMLALAVDVGTTSARYQSQRHAANTAAYAGAYTLYGLHLGANSAVTDTTVWNAVVTSLKGVGLSVVTAQGAVPVADPCAAGYQGNQVAMSATYLDSNLDVITTDGTTPWLVGSGYNDGYDSNLIPGLAAGIKVTLGACQPAGFGGVIGHPQYTVWVTGEAGGHVPGAEIAPTPVPISSCTQPCPEPYALSGAPGGPGSKDGDCKAPGDPSQNVVVPGTGDPNLFYCPGAYHVGDTVTVYSNGVCSNCAFGNNYGNDSNFKGYTGWPPYGSTQQCPGYLGWVCYDKTGVGDQGLNCTTNPPPTILVAVISGVDHVNQSTDKWVPLEYAVVQLTTCTIEQLGGTIVDYYDPNGYGIILPPVGSTPTNTPLPTDTPGPTDTPTDTPLPTNTPGGPTDTPTSTPTTTPTSTPGSTSTPTPTATPVVPTKKGSSKATSTNNSLSIQEPSGASPGDVLIAQITIQNNYPTMTTVPSGWYLIRQDYGNVSSQVTQVLYYHVVGSTEPPSYTWSWSVSGGSAADGVGSIVDYSNVDTTTPIITDNGSASSRTSSTIMSPQLTTPVSNTVVIGFFGIQGQTTITVPVGETQECTTGDALLTLACADEVQTTAGTGPLSVTVPMTGSNYSIGQLVALQVGAAPTSTPTNTPTATPTNTPTGPTSTPMPTDTPGGPTNTPMPTDTPGTPTTTPTDTPTGQPTGTSTPWPTPRPTSTLAVPVMPVP